MKNCPVHTKTKLSPDSCTLLQNFYEKNNLFIVSNLFSKCMCIFISHVVSCTKYMVQLVIRK